MREKVEIKMSKIEELLKNEKVVWKKLEEVCEILDSMRKPISKKDRKPGQYPYYGANGVQDYIDNYIFDGQFILMGEDGSVMNKDNSPVLHWIGGEKLWVNNHAHVLGQKEEYTLKYLYYYLSKVDVSQIVRGTPPKLNQANMRNIDIPIPSPETQKKIVEILDKFTDYVTELQAELQAELQNRTKQYEYYRNMLLSEEYLNKLSDKLGIFPKEAENQIRCTTLGEIGKICMCKRILKEQTLPKGDVPFYKIGTFGKKADAFISREVFDEYKEKYSYPKKGEVLISCSGTIGRTVIFDGKDAYFQDSNIIWLSHDESIVLNKYLFYFYQNTRWNATSGGTISRLYTYNLVNLDIELPSLPLQNKIVEILDKFQSMLSDTKGLLPKEIEQRQKQYEYYREKLLTFDVECSRTNERTNKQAR